MGVQPGITGRSMRQPAVISRGAMTMNALPILSRLKATLHAWLATWLHSRRWQISSGVGVILVALLIAGLLIVRQRQLASQASASAAHCAVNASTVSMAPPGVTLPVKIPAGEPRVVATVNGEPLCAEGLELRVAGALANHRQVLQQLQQTSPAPPPSAMPPSVLASLRETPNQVRHDALTQMIQEELLFQEGKRLGLTVSLSAAQAMARQQIQIYHSMPASNPGRASFQTYLRINHLTEQTFVSDPGILQGFVRVMTIAVMRQHIQKGLPPDVSPTDGINAYVQHLWQTGDVRVYLPAQLGW